MTVAIDRAKQYSEEKLKLLREGLKTIVPADDVVVTCGSYARREASEESDIDFFVISESNPSGDAPPPWFEKAKSAIGGIVAIEPAGDGAFSQMEFADAMLHNIGGDGDNNKKITRRMLLLLEGEWLHNVGGLKKIRLQMLERYVGEGMTDHQLALFLLNDIIRYYRTMAVDYEFKTAEGASPKPWGIRNIKLVFSRKLLYASGLFSVALTADRSREQKISKLEELFEMPVIDRMITICGRAQMSSVLQSYNLFLDRIENSNVRAKLKALTKEERDDSLFRELKNEGHHFTRELLRLFEQTFDSTHPIRRAVIF
jgi:hypothetical protein